MQYELGSRRVYWLSLSDQSEASLKNVSVLIGLDWMFMTVSDIGNYQDKLTTCQLRFEQIAKSKSLFTFYKIQINFQINDKLLNILQKWKLLIFLQPMNLCQQFSSKEFPQLNWADSLFPFLPSGMRHLEIYLLSNYLK